VAHRAGALFIADEMITGFGRTGLMFGSNHDGVVPDIMTTGKGMASGFPMSALVSTNEIMAAEPFSLPSASSSSYGGNPLAAAAGLITIRTIIEERLVENSARIGAMFADGLRAIAARRKSIANVRGRGLLIGFDLVSDNQAAKPKFLGKDGCVMFFRECLANGVIMMGYTPRVRLHPPLILTADECSQALSVIDRGLARIEAC
jgi:4-aminobutyrate aminotransferase-like enzyme